MLETLLSRLLGWILSFFGGAKAVGDTILTWLLTQAAPYLPDVGSALAPAEIQKLLGNINYLFPLSELVAFATAYGALWGLWRGFRWVKSWFVGAAT